MPEALVPGPPLPEERGPLPADCAALVDLTLREEAVLHLLADGFPNRTIARWLGISEKTVKNHLSAVYGKIGAADRTQAAIFARNAGVATGFSLGCLDTVLTGLTGREKAVLRLVAGGLSNRLIARRLGISEKTVKNHLSAVYGKIGALDRTQAAICAHRAGLLGEAEERRPSCRKV